MSTSRSRRKSSPQGVGRRPSAATLAALEQVCWHLTCCDFLFDVLEEAGVDMHQLAAGVEEARFHAERLFYDTARKRGRAVSVGSGAAVLLKRFEDQFEGTPRLSKTSSRLAEVCRGRRRRWAVREACST